MVPLHREITFSVVAMGVACTPVNIESTVRIIVWASVCAGLIAAF
jgi:hypothetical protein